MSDIVVFLIIAAVVGVIVFNGVKSSGVQKTLDELQAKIDELRKKL